MNKYVIGITTFSKRFNYIETLLKQIRQFTDLKIMVVINGEKNGDFKEDYRKKILELCTSIKNVYPIFYLETRGLSKLWNTLLITSNSDNLLILNDDIEIYSSDIFNILDNYVPSSSFKGLTKINGSFSHFIVNKPLMDKIGYFDERLLGFGEEDGDITYRLLKIGIDVGNISISNIRNIVSDVRHDHVKSGIGKYSKFNRDYIYGEKYSKNLTSPYRGLFDTPMEQTLSDLDNYPSERFFIKNKNNL
jgi:hypothetical protein